MKGNNTMERRDFIKTVGAVGASLAVTDSQRASAGEEDAVTMFRSMDPGSIGVGGSLEDTLRYAQLGGFEGMDGSLTATAELVRRLGHDHVKALYGDAGLRVGAQGLPMAWRVEENEFREFLTALPEMAAASAALGATGCVTWLTPLSQDLRFRENFHFHVQRLRPIAEILKDHGLRLGLEPVGPRTIREKEGFGFIYTVYGALGLSEAIGTGNVGLLLDSWHWYTALGTASDIASLNASDVVHVHINDAPLATPVEKQIDNKRALPGETGVIDLKTFLTMLKKIGYTGAVTPEPFSARLNALGPEQAATEAGASLKRTWEMAGI
jgi:sugar phosphate isomerase/epimerase